MSGDQLNLDAFGTLDAIEAKAREEGRQLTLALVAEVRRLRALPDMTLGWDSRRGVMVFTDVDAAQRVTLREWIDGP